MILARRRSNRKSMSMASDGRARKTKRAYVPIPDLSAETIARFEEKVDRTGNCHTWTAYTDKAGYGLLNVMRHPYLATRIAYKLATGKDPEGLHVCHRCDNPSCVRPDHLFLGTDADNLRDMSAKGRAPRGSRNGHNRRAGKLTEDIVIEIKRAIAEGARTSDLARKYGVGRPQISNIKHGHKWSWLNVS